MSWVGSWGPAVGLIAAAGKKEEEEGTNAEEEEVFFVCLSGGYLLFWPLSPPPLLFSSLDWCQVFSSSSSSFQPPKTGGGVSPLLLCHRGRGEKECVGAKKRGLISSLSPSLFSLRERDKKSRSLVFFLSVFSEKGSLSSLSLSPLHRDKEREEEKKKSF